MKDETVHETVHKEGVLTQITPGTGPISDEELIRRVQHALESGDFLHALRREFDLSFSTTITREDNKLKITFRQEDTGAEIMTLSDLSAFLQMDRQTLRQMTEQRAQSRPNPIPFVKIAKSLRFKRADILAWLDRSKDFAGSGPVVPPLPFGKVKKGKAKK